MGNGIFITVFFILFLPGICNAQELQGAQKDSGSLYSYVQHKYGLDPELVTGTQFYNDYHRVLNHPYYQTEKSLPGNVTISGKKFDDLLIQYDLFNQWLVLEYQGLPGGAQKIILEALSTEAFLLDGFYFEKKALDKREALFYQLLQAEGISFHIHWQKKLRQTSNNLDYAESFSDPIRTYFLEYNGEISSFSKRKNLVSVLPPGAQKQTRKYLKTNRIRFQQAGMNELLELLDFMASLQQ